MLLLLAVQIKITNANPQHYAVSENQSIIETLAAIGDDIDRWLIYREVTRILHTIFHLSILARNLNEI